MQTSSASSSEWRPPLGTVGLNLHCTWHVVLSSPFSVSSIVMTKLSPLSLWRTLAGDLRWASTTYRMYAVNILEHSLPVLLITCCDIDQKVWLFLNVPYFSVRLPWRWPSLSLSTSRLSPSFLRCLATTRNSRSLLCVKTWSGQETSAFSTSLWSSCDVFRRTDRLHVWCHGFFVL